MGSSLHNAHHAWIFRILGDLFISGQLTAVENHGLLVKSGSIFDIFTEVYAGSVKLADYSITPNVTLYPSIVFECGWSESFPRLKDKDLWISGCGGHVKLVILIKFNKLAGGRVSGKAEVLAGDAAANDRLIQTEPIFPPPSAPFATAQSIQVTRSQIFGGQILPGRNPPRASLNVTDVGEKEKTLRHL